MRKSVSFSRGLVRSIRSPLDLAASAAEARRGLISLATSSAVAPLGSSLTLPSGSLILMVSAMGGGSDYRCGESRPRLSGRAQLASIAGLRPAAPARAPVPTCLASGVEDGGAGVIQIFDCRLYPSRQRFHVA